MWINLNRIILKHFVIHICWLSDHKVFRSHLSKINSAEQIAKQTVMDDMEEGLYVYEIISH